LAPGESTVVELIFKTKSYKTKISKYATIYSNDPDQPTAKIHMTSVVYPEADSTLPYRLAPDRVTLSKDNDKGKIVLENVGDSKLFVEAVGIHMEELKVNVKNDDPKPGQKTELKFEWTEEFDKENMERSVTFHVSGSELGTYRFSVPLTIQGTDPTPPKAKARPRTKKQSSAKPRRSVQKPARRPAQKVQKPVSTKASEIQQTETTGIKKTESDDQVDVKSQNSESKIKENLSTDTKAADKKPTKQTEPTSEQDE
jgi:hypothetical protein